MTPIQPSRRPLAPEAERLNVAGLPVEWRPDRESVRLRMFNPEDSRLFVPRLFGAGWDVNLGAVAVRLGLLRPDDTLADLAGYVPQHTATALRVLPWIGAASAVATAARGWRAASRFPTNWDATFRPSSFGPPLLALGIPAVLAVGIALWSTTPRAPALIAKPADPTADDDTPAALDLAHAQRGGLPAATNAPRASEDVAAPPQDPDEPTASTPDDDASVDILRHAIASGTAFAAAAVIAVSVASARAPRKRNPWILAAVGAYPTITAGLTVGALRSALANVRTTLRGQGS